MVYETKPRKHTDKGPAPPPPHIELEHCHQHRSQPQHSYPMNAKQPPLPVDGQQSGQATPFYPQVEKSLEGSGGNVAKELPSTSEAGISQSIKKTSQEKNSDLNSEVGTPCLTPRPPMQRHYSVVNPRSFKLNELSTANFEIGMGGWPVGFESAIAGKLIDLV